jgi:hypothetical protein
MGKGEEIKGKESRKVKKSSERLGKWREGRWMMIRETCMDV